MKTKPQVLVAGMLLATVGAGIAQPTTEFIRLPDLTNNPTYSFGRAWGERRAEI